MILNVFRDGTMIRISQTIENFITKHHRRQTVEQIQVKTKTYNERANEKPEKSQSKTCHDLLQLIEDQFVVKEIQFSLTQCPTQHK